jgi:hypothetical protein
MAWKHDISQHFPSFLQRSTVPLHFVLQSASEVRFEIKPRIKVIVCPWTEDTFCMIYIMLKDFSSSQAFMVHNDIANTEVQAK